MITASERALLYSTFIFRPGATGTHAPTNSNVFTSWPVLMSVIGRTRNRGIRKIQFDNRFAPAYTDQFGVTVASDGGLYPCVIPAPPAGEVWDMTDVIWIDRCLPPGANSMMIQIADGGTGLRNRITNLKRIDMMLLNLIYNGQTVGNHPFESAEAVATPAYGWNFSGVRLRIYNTTALAQPMILMNTSFSFMDWANNSEFGRSTTLPAPVIELALGNTFTFITEGLCRIANNAIVGPVGSTFNISMNANALPIASSQTFLFPAFEGALAVTNSCVLQKWAPSSTIAVTPGPTTATFGQVTRVDATGGVVAISLPVAKLTAPTTGVFGHAGAAITVQEVGGGANIITVSPQAGETINGASSFAMPAAAYASQRFWCDGLGAWFAVA